MSTVVPSNLRTVTGLLLVFAMAVLTVLGVLSTGRISAHVAVENFNGDITNDAIEHARGNLGSGQSKRWWADTPRCETRVVKVPISNGPNGELRAVYKFQVFTDVNGRAHAMEAGGFADSTQSWCNDRNAGAWTGTQVNLDDPIFLAGGQRPSRATIGVTSEVEAQPGVRASVAPYNFDWLMRLAVGISNTSQGGAYGWNGDGAGYKVNGQTVWCAGLDFGAINNPYRPGVPTNVRWPGWYLGQCSQNFLYRAGSFTTGNYDTNWGAYALGAMKNGNSSQFTAVQCGNSCAIGNNIPGMSVRSDGRLNNFNLEAAGIKNHDGVGTYNGSTGVPGYPAATSADNAAAARGIPFMLPVSEAWITMEWPASTRGGLQVTKYPGTSGPDSAGHPTGPIANPATSPGNRNICVNPNIGCGTANPFVSFSATNALPGGLYQVDVSAPAGFQIKEVRFIYGTNFSLPYGVLQDPENDGRYDVYVGAGFGANTTLYLDVYYEPATNRTMSCVVRTNPAVPEPGQEFEAWMEYSYNGPRATLQTYSVLVGGDQFTPPVLPNTSEPVINNPPVVNAIRNLGRHTGPAGSYDYDAWVQVKDRPDTREPCPGNVKIASKPYFKVWTNDVQVGGSFAPCTTRESGATIVGYGGTQGETPPDSNAFAGSSAQYGVSALGEIRNFFSAGQRGPRTTTQGQWPTPPHGLTFANARISGIPNNDPGDNEKVQDYGGVSGLLSCADDWINTVPEGVPATTGTSISVGSLTGTVHNVSTGTVVINGGTINGPRAIILENASDVVINGDIISPNIQSTLYIITNGNIKITADTRLVDAVLITKKTLYTCTKGGNGVWGDPWPASELFNECGGRAPLISSKLVIRGAVIADQIKLQRTFGTRHLSRPNELALSGVNGNVAAEEIIFDPALYLTRPGLESPGRTKSKIQFMTSLPPIL